MASGEGGGEQMQMVHEWQGAPGRHRDQALWPQLARCSGERWCSALPPGPCPGPSPRASLFLCPPASMMEYSLDGHNVSLSAIRTVRVLRPLRAINRVPSE